MNKQPGVRRLTWFALFAGMAMMLPRLSVAAPVALATAPLANATTTTVLPNLMFVIDASGSMDWNYLPDWVDDRLCKDTNGGYSQDCEDQPPFQSPDFNGVYYNPAVSYVPPLNASGDGWPNQTSWTSVKNDAYEVQSGSSTNLVSGYVDVEWCTRDQSRWGGYTYNDCLRNDNYILPGVVGGKVYDLQHATTSSGSGAVATGSLAAPTTASRSWGPHYYVMVPGEYCDSLNLTNCQTTKTATFSYPAKLRWCSDAAMTNCQANRTSVYDTPRYPTKTVSASATITVSGSNSTTSISSIKVNGKEILSGRTSGERNNGDVANAIASNINDCTSATTGHCTIAGYSARASGSTVTLFAPLALQDVVATPVVTIYSGSKRVTPSAFSGYASVPGSFSRIDIVPGTTSYPYPGTATKAASRSDCAGDTCTYAEEMTNFANWWTYYQTRMQAMKTAVSRAFNPIDNRYRVGFIDIYGGNYLPIAKFDNGTAGKSVKELWYKKLFSINPNGGTPLRSALSRVGLIFAGKKPVGSADPVEYSCQQNFTLLTTDGYWNGDTGRDNGIVGVGDDSIGDMDSDAGTRPKYEGPTASSNSLADVAKYYYDTDLRDRDAWDNCVGALGSDVCANNVFVSGTDNNTKQHMTTFTLGLGVDGALKYTSDYNTATSGDFYNLKTGQGSPVVNWPVPRADTETAVDDLWHAAVNGGGTYFSAKDPAQLGSGLNSALAAIGAKLGAGAAAATSTLNPVAGDNFAYVASYTTVKWQGNLEARTINLDTGVVSKSASWCVENVVAGSCSAPASIVADSSGGSTVYNCVTPNSSSETCGGTLDGTDCKVQLPVACTGTLGAKVGATTDTRNIYMRGSAGTLVNFNYDNLSETQQVYFTGTSLSQWSQLDTTQKTAAAGTNLVNFLRGQTGYEDRTSNDALNRLYRYREATMGDAIESQPAFVGKPTFSYTDLGYSAFVTANATRAKTVFLGTNDGMLHAFDATTGNERWAYVPSMIIPNLWKLADKNYATLHTNYVNGSPVVADVYDSAADSGKGAWKTILVAGLNGGGRGYFALDISNPSSPSLLWEIDSSTEANLGYTFGQPVVTKKSDGTWVVLFTSGYNNINPGDGNGYLYVRNALTGAHISRISTGAGDTTTPSGLAKIATWADSPEKNNTATYTYGGDLDGNLWRFDINANTVMKLAVLKDSAGNTQPITSRPELGAANRKRIVFVGTGKYLERDDLTNVQHQSLYAIKDDDVATTLADLRSTLVNQTISTSGAGRSASSNPVDFRTGRGWYIDFPDSGERVNVDARLDTGSLVVPTTVPSSTVCSPGGYGWLNYFNYLTGSAVSDAENNLVSQKFNAPIVGVNVYYLANGKKITSVVTADNPTPEQPPKSMGGNVSNSGFMGKRVIWRELVQ